MRRGKQPRVARRSVQFEKFEERLVLSGQPFADFLLTPHELERIEPHYGEIAPHLREAHSATGLNQVRASYGLRGAGQTVAVIDSGIAYDHVALGGGFGSGYRVVGGWDFTAENDADPYDDGPAGFHGTHVAGIIGSNSTRHAGVAPDVDLVGLRVFDDKGAGYFSWVENALQWVHNNRFAFANPITTVNLSLGASWNADSPPGWARLEDEFLQLKNDGIFISVSAGNSFSSYNAAGVSYPAASPYVVPVASVGDNGSLSDFSQRNSRVLAAPGERIASTVPDHVFGADGNPNDWGLASGTSMAAPYVAGASVLLREAMQLLGQQNITQDTIYGHLRNTSDLVHDSATQASYHRINLQNAFDTLIPADDYGSHAATAHSLGTLSDQLSLSGMIGRLDDADYFRFTAGATGSVTFTAQTQGYVAPRWNLEGAPLQIEGETFSFDVVAGQSYAVGIRSTDGIGRYELSAELEAAAIDLGTVDFTQLSDINLQDGAWYQIRATRSGQFTALAEFAQAAGNVQLQLFSAAQQSLATGVASANAVRLDVDVTAGQTYLLHVAGTNADVDLSLLNLLAASGNQVDIFGTNANDRFQFTAGTDQHEVSVQGVTYRFDAHLTTSLRFHGQSGADIIYLQGNQSNESLVMDSGDVRLTSAAYQVRVLGVETVRADGGGGWDAAVLCISNAASTFHGRSDHSLMYGGGFYHVVSQFDRVEGRANGDRDVARLYGSRGNDTFHGRSDHAVIYGSGFYNIVSGFRQVDAHGGGGNDQARFYGASGRHHQNTFVASPHQSTLYGAGFYNTASGFREVQAYSGNGATNTAYFYDSSGNDVFVATPLNAEMVGNGFINRAAGFQHVRAISESGGRDVARFYDSDGRDTFHRRSNHSLMYGRGFYNVAEGFAQVEATAGQAALDEAVFYDLGEGEAFVGAGSAAMVSNDLCSAIARNFGKVSARSLRDAIPTVEVSAIDFLFKQLGKWR